MSSDDHLSSSNPLACLPNYIIKFASTYGPTRLECPRIHFMPWAKNRLSTSAQICLLTSAQIRVLASALFFFGPNTYSFGLNSSFRLTIQDVEFRETICAKHTVVMQLRVVCEAQIRLVSVPSIYFIGFLMA